MSDLSYLNPFRPGAGHMPPYLAGRNVEQEEMRRLLHQAVITENMVLTGLRGVGKTVLLEKLKPLAIQCGWLWANADLSESVSVTEETLATRILTDMALCAAPLLVREEKQFAFGFTSEERVIRQPLNFGVLKQYYDRVPGLVADKLKAVLEFVWDLLPKPVVKGVIFAYDEAQNMTDHAARDQYPLSVLLEVFQSIQRKGIPFMLVMTGLPTLFPKLVEARTYAERMFHIVFLKPLDEDATKEAILKPVEDTKCPIKFSPEAVDTIWRLSRGYPHFIQFICKEIFDIWLIKVANNEVPSIPYNEIILKLDTNFFSGRWAKATDRQRDLLHVISLLDGCDTEFTVQEVVAESKNAISKPFTASHVNQMLANLTDLGLIYKNRFGKYSLAVPLMSGFIKRQILSEASFNVN
ncbi:MAG: hypothetical protein LBP99_04365 [Azoarcus sp.]|nr:hypothetical protein [Azoarcus sp.]